MKVIRSNSYTAYIYFYNADTRRVAYGHLTHTCLGGRRLSVLPLSNNMLEVASEGRSLLERPTPTLAGRPITDRMAPWAAMPYDRQLLEKLETFQERLRPIIPADFPPLVIIPHANDRGLPQLNQPDCRL
jgi:hypothetical protein